MIDTESRLRDFPTLRNETYLNTAAEGIPPLVVGEALQAYWHDKQLGMDGRVPHNARLESCRQVAARMIGLKPAEVSFCSCSSEAYNLLASALSLTGEDRVVITDLDFPAGATPWLRARERPHVDLWRAADSGELDVDDLVPLLGPATRLVQVSLVSFYNGFRLDWPAVRDAVRRVAPDAVLAVDVTQALGRIPTGCADADIQISSTHKWALGTHGGCVVGIPDDRSERLTSHAGGWFHLTNAFDADRFERAESRPGAPSFSVGMPNYPAIYALDAGLRYLESVGLDAIADHADPLVRRLAEGFDQLGLQLLAPYRADRPTGILAFRHERSAEIHETLRRESIHVMHHAGRLRFAVHGYNTPGCIDHALEVLAGVL